MSEFVLTVEHGFIDDKVLYECYGQYAFEISFDGLAVEQGFITYVIYSGPT